jgi:hypothetical protein
MLTATLLATAGCGTGAISATVQFVSMIPGCVRMTATDSKTGKSTQGTYAIDPTRGQYKTAIYPQDGWGTSIDVKAEGLEHDCNGATISRTDETETLPESGFNEVVLVLTATDADGDSYVSNTATLPGTDCNDNNHDISPAASEICGDGIDNNCNGLIDEGC